MFTVHLLVPVGGQRAARSEDRGMLCTGGNVMVVGRKERLGGGVNYFSSINDTRLV